MFRHFFYLAAVSAVSLGGVGLQSADAQYAGSGLYGPSHFGRASLRYSATCARLGRSLFCSDNLGGSATVRRFGNMWFVDGEPRRAGCGLRRMRRSGIATVRTLGSITFIDGPGRFSMTAVRAGRTIFVDTNFGCHATIMRAGNITFIDGNCVSGTVMRLGNTAFVDLDIEVPRRLRCRCIGGRRFLPALPALPTSTWP